MTILSIANRFKIIHNFMMCALLLIFLAACAPQDGELTQDGTETAAVTLDVEATETPEAEVQATSTVTRTATPNPRIPNLSGETITIYHLGDASSEFAELLTLPMIHGVEDMVNVVNRTGGVYGAEIELKFMDTEGVVENTLEAYASIKEADENMLLLVVYSVEELEALAPLAAEDGIPILAAVPSAKALYETPDSTVFSLAPLREEEFALFVDYVAENWRTIKPLGAKNNEIKLAYISWGTLEGRTDLSKVAQAYAEEQGIAVVAKEVIGREPYGSTTTAILNAGVAGANVIYTAAGTYSTANLLNDLHNMAVQADFLVGGGYASLDMAGATYLAAPSYMDDLYAAYPMAWWSETENPAIVFALDHFERDPEEQTGGRLLMQGSIDLAKYTFEQAILKEGFDDLDGEAVLEALSDVEDYAVLDGLMTVDFSDGRRSAGEAQMLMVLDGLETVYIVEDYAALPDLRPEVSTDK